MYRILIFICIFSQSLLFAQQRYQYEVDLNNIVNDQIKVRLLCPKIGKKQVIFAFPSNVPSSYAKLDFGRFISKFSAKDGQGNYLNIVQKDVNTYQINNATQLTTIEYLVDDSWDMIEDKQFVFGATGTNIEEKCILMNAGGFFGYCENYENTPFEVNVKYPQGWYIATNLYPQKTNTNQTTYLASNYARLVDCPIFATAVTDTFKVKKANTEIVFSLFAPSKNFDAKYFKPLVEKVLEQTNAYTHNLPLKQFHTMVYLMPKSANNVKLREIGLFGAMEHSGCSVLVLPEDLSEYSPTKMSFEERFKQLLTNNLLYAGINTNLPSVYFTDFKYQKPSSTAHLWFYASLSNYFGIMTDLKSNPNQKEYWLSFISKKINLAKQYPENVPLTTLSLHIFDYPNPYDVYIRFFDYGVLTMMCLDIEIIKATNGEKNLLDVTELLMKQFSVAQPFSEAELIPAYIEKSNPALKTFFDTYILKAGIPNLKSYFAEVGVQLEEEKNSLTLLNTMSETQKKYFKKWAE